MFAPLIHKLAATDWRRNINNSRFLRETSEEISLQPVQKIKKGSLAPRPFHDSQLARGAFCAEPLNPDRPFPADLQSTFSVDGPQSLAACR